MSNQNHKRLANTNTTTIPSHQSWSSFSINCDFCFLNSTCWFVKKLNDLKTSTVLQFGRLAKATFLEMPCNPWLTPRFGEINKKLYHSFIFFLTSYLDETLDTMWKIFQNNISVPHWLLSLVTCTLLDSSGLAAGAIKPERPESCPCTKPMGSYLKASGR